MIARKLSVGAIAILVIAAWSYGASSADTDTSSSHELLDRIERKITKEPQYKAQPQYALVVLGSNANTKVWMVEDGKTLYVDKNANGDLTDDGPPLAPINERDLGDNRWDFDYFLDELTPIDGSRHTDFQLRRWNYGGENDSYGLSLSVDKKMPMYAGWFGTFWAASPEAAPIMHFGGPLEPRLLRRKEFIIGASSNRLSLAFINHGRGEGAMSRLSIDALPKTIIPILRIDWPVADGTPSLQTSYPLKDRCCYWEFYEPNFRIPKGVVAGEATVTVSFKGGDCPFELTIEQIKVPVLAEGSDTAVK